MGGFKKEAARKERQGQSNNGMGNVKTKGTNFYHDQKKAKTLKMFKDGKARHNRHGDIVQPAAYQSKEAPIARVEPHRKWFANSRVIAQNSLAQFREAVKQTDNPYTYLLKGNKLPMSLIRDGQDENAPNGLKQHAAKIATTTSPFKQVFGPDSRRKRVKLDIGSMEEMAQKNQKMEDEYAEKRQEQLDLNPDMREQEDEPEETGEIGIARENIFQAGKSKRIWNELYKVVDSSDVLIQVLDARDPEGTRCRHIEKYIKTEQSHKHVLLLLNKTDLVPTKVAALWVKSLSQEYPCLAFRSSIKNPFGKGSLISLLRQFSSLHKNRKQISVGMIGYPNVGKSSLINTLRGKKVTKTAPLPGETKVWQYIKLMQRILLIDCPGVVPPSQDDSDSDLLLRGVVRVENVANPAQYVHSALNICEKRHVERTYSVRNWNGADEFLEKLSEKTGKLFKGGERDLDGAAKIFLNDFLRGKIPWFVKPPGWAESQGNGPSQAENEKGGIIKSNQKAVPNVRKRKREDDETGEDDGRDPLGGNTNNEVLDDDVPDANGSENDDDLRTRTSLPNEDASRPQTSAAGQDEGGVRVR